MKVTIPEYLAPKNWLPLGVAFGVGLGLAFFGNLLFGTELELIGIVVAIVLLVLFLGALSVALYVLRMVQQRARWEQENFQIALQAKLEVERETRQAESSRKRQEMNALLEIVTKAAPVPRPDIPVDKKVLALVQQAMSLAADEKLSLADKFEALQKAVSEIQNTLNPK